MYGANTPMGLIPKNPAPKSCFINQLDGGYTINLQGNNFYPVKVAVTIDEVKQIITDFFNTAEIIPSDESKAQGTTSTASQGENLLA